MTTKTLYAYTFNAYLTHQDPAYRNRLKIGFTVRDAKIRIDEQDTTAVSEPPIIPRTWKVDIATKQDVDDAVRAVLIERFGCKEARVDKQREWIVFPDGTMESHLELVEEAIDSLGAYEKDISLITLHPEQQAMVDEALTLQIAQGYAACGVGKTFIELALHERLLPAPKTDVNIVISSGIDLVNQVSREFVHHTTTGLEYRAWTPVIVHSGTSIIEGVTAETDPDRIRDQIRSTKKPVCVFTTFDSVQEAVRGIELAKKQINVKIVDEAHRSVTIGQTKFSFAARLIGKREYYFTATPRVLCVN